jgi:hypothetical protein
LGEKCYVEFNLEYPILKRVFKNSDLATQIHTLTSLKILAVNDVRGEDL